MNRLSVVTFGALTAFASQAFAVSLGIDWFGGSGAGNQSQMQLTETAGVIPQTNWNSFTGATQAVGQALIDDAGAATGSSVTWLGSPNLWDTNIADTPGNLRMMLGYLDTNDTSTTTISVTGLPASVTSGSGYNVIVYFDGDNGGNNRVAAFTLGGVTQYARDAANTNFSGTFTLAGTTTAPVGAMDNNAAGATAIPAGNFVVFAGLTASSFTLTSQASVSSDATNRASVQAIQITTSPIPEPTTGMLLLLGLGVVGRAAFRRLRV